jgi:histidinol-phosphate phosphatase family protein
MEIRCLRESTPLGTAGALLDALPSLPERFIVSYGDAMMDVDLERFLAYHAAAAVVGTILLHPNDHPHDSDLVEMDRGGLVRAVHGYPHPAGAEYPNLVNAALYVLERDALEPYRMQFHGRDIAKHLIPAMLRDGARVAGYASREYIKDIGTPERLERVNRDAERGVIARRNARVPAPAVFLDRDGTLNAEVNHLSHRDQLVLLDGAAAAVRCLNRAGLLTVILTNQPVIARGDCTLEELDGIHARLDTLLGAGGAYVDAKFVCPHHPDGGYPCERPEYKVVCTCRKPAPGLARDAIQALNIDTAKSWLVGDSTVDLAVAAEIGVPSILVRTGYGGRDARCAVIADFECADIGDAVAFITGGYPTLRQHIDDAARVCLPGTVVAIGGLARSGKSTYAGALRWALRDRGMRAHVIPLDGWLRPLGGRGDSVRTRYDYAEIELLVTSLLPPRAGGLHVTFRQYDRYTQSVRTAADLGWTIRPEDVVILEGVPALDVPGLQQALVRCYVDLDDTTRHARFARTCRDRGEDDVSIAQRWHARERDEHELIAASRASATHVLDGALTLSSRDNDSE